MGAVQGEKHVLLECTRTELSGVMREFTELLKCCTGQWNSMNNLMRTDNSDGLA